MRQLMGINGETFLVLEHETREMCFAVTAKVFGEKSGEFTSFAQDAKKRTATRCVRHNPLGVFSCHQNLRRF